MNILVRQYLQDQTGIYTGHICTGHILDKDWAMYRTKHRTKCRTSHFGQTHFKQGQGQDIKQFGVGRGQREMAKNGDTEIDNSHDKGIWTNRSFIGKAYGQ